MKILKVGSKGADVIKWQHFLIGQNFLYKGEADGDFGPKTLKATKLFQQQQNLWPIHGEVDGKTLGAAMALGFETGLISYPKGKAGPHWPSPPKGLKPLGYADREKVFGHIAYEPAPTRSNPEGIKIVNDWQSKHLCKVKVPQIAALAAKKPQMGFPKSGSIFIHKLLKDPVLELFQVWEDKVLVDLIETWGGSWCARYTRGSRTNLSNHSYATAFDINAYPWNALGAQPALVCHKGSVRELAGVAASLGWWWGGWGWPKNPRLDGMHFEATAKLIEVSDDPYED
jgi:peptidoglycan hydrolase-like protein with peptidoglycan-binding domain